MKTKVTLATVKADIANDPALAAAPKAILANALISFMMHVRENSEKFSITPKSDDAIMKYIKGLTNE